MTKDIPGRDEQTAAETPSLYWKARPIFMSSTFQDMHTERDYLRDNAFKRLEERLRERCAFLEIIDLRQGVDTTKAKTALQREMEVIKGCLDEIDRSRPFFIAFLGDRYGYIPSDEQIANAAHSVGLPKPEQVRGKSIIELEILYGALENTRQRARCWFFFRTVDRRGMPPIEAARYPAEQNPDSLRKLNELKARIEKMMAERVLKYQLSWNTQERKVVGLTELDARIEEKLWPDLDADTVELIRMKPRTWQDADARMQADFVSEHLRTYVARPALLHPVVTFATSQSISDRKQILVMTGPSGAGKSSLFSNVYALLSEQAKDGRVFLLAHAAGLFPGSEQIDRMMRRWVYELAEFLEIADPLAVLNEADGEEKTRSSVAEAVAQQINLGEEVEAAFWKIVAQAANRTRVVMLIDALDQFEPTVRAKCLTWIPGALHANVRLIATAEAFETIAHGVQPVWIEVRSITNLSEAEANEVAQKIYREMYHHAPCEPALKVLLSKGQAAPSKKKSLLDRLNLFDAADRPKAYCNLLWFTLALHELNLLGMEDFEHGDQKYSRLTYRAHYCSPTGKSKEFTGAG